MHSPDPKAAGAAPPDLLSIPATALVREARSLVERALDESIVRHSLRAYLYAKAYARRRSLEFDDEGLAVAALFHDLGLSAELRADLLAFQLRSSRECARFLRDMGVAAERVAPLVDAIDYHFQVWPRWSKGNVVGLLQVGAWMNATGLRRGGLGAEGRAIAEALPRGSFDETFRRGLRASATSLGACLGAFFPSWYKPADAT